MKISKVDNARTAVAHPYEQKRGKLYYDPKNQLVDSATLKKHIENRIREANQLYQVFDARIIKTIPAAKPFQRPLNTLNILNNFSKLIKSVAQTQKWPHEASALNKYHLTSPRDLQEVSPCAKQVVDQALRKGLRKEAAFVETLLSHFLRADCVALLEVADSAEMGRFLALLDKDYGKKEQGRAIQTSIERQDVKVQVTTHNGQTVLALANYTHPKKQALFATMVHYTQDPAAIKRVLYDHVDEFFGITAETTKTQMILPALASKKADKASKKPKTANKNAPIPDQKPDFKQIQADLAEWLMNRYRATASLEHVTPEALYWYQTIQQFLSDYFQDRRHLNTKQLTYAQLMSMVQGKLKHFFIAKYIDMGKAVYHFCQLPPADQLEPKKNSPFGQVHPEFEKGLTSFAYERIKARENWEQELAVSVVYAANTLTQSVMKEHSNEDFLTLDLTSQDQSNLFDDTTLRNHLLRFWGGASSYLGQMTLDGLVLTRELQQRVYALRNTSFHYSDSIIVKSKKKNDTKAPAQQSPIRPIPHLQQLAQQEKQDYGRSIWQKYLTNNVFAFYSENILCPLVTKLHSEAKYTPSFVPAFGSVFKRVQLAEFMQQNSIPLPEVHEPNTQAEQLRGALYFTLKEIYYYDFVRDDARVLRYLRAALKAEAADPTLTPERIAALDNFKKVTTPDDKQRTLAEICQRALMTYALHNNTNYRHTERLGKEKSYEHCKLILTSMLHKAFAQFLRDNYGFLFQPKHRLVSDPDALPDRLAQDTRYRIKEYDFLFQTDSMPTDNHQWDYYALGKLLPPKQLNLLIGALKRYQQYAQDVQKRSQSAEATLEDHRETSAYGQIVEILQFCLLNSGQISQEVTDYYEDKNTYATYLSHYVDFKTSGYGYDYGDLEHFCKNIASLAKRGNGNFLYINAQKPILHRGIELARMYGTDAVLHADSLKDKLKVTEANINKLAEQAEDKLKAVLQSGQCHNEKEQKALRLYQNLKQKVELVDIQTYSELLFDLHSPLVNWCYMRERDNLYLLLGYHYIKEFWSDQHPDNSALFYLPKVFQYGAPLKFPKEKSSLDGVARLSTKKAWLEKRLGKDVFAVERLLAVDENKLTVPPNRSNDTQEKSDRYRNDIMHFRYFRDPACSMLTLYQNAYYIMGYDRKLSNAVLPKLESILQRYSLETALYWNQQGILRFKTPPVKQEVTEKEAINHGTIPKNMPKKEIPKNPTSPQADKPIVSKKFSYKLKGQSESVEVRARSGGFCDTVAILLDFTRKSDD